VKKNNAGYLIWILKLNLFLCLEFSWYEPTTTNGLLIVCVVLSWFHLMNRFIMKIVCACSKTSVAYCLLRTGFRKVAQDCISVKNVCCTFVDGVWEFLSDNLRFTNLLHSLERKNLNYCQQFFSHMNLKTTHAPVNVKHDWFVNL